MPIVIDASVALKWVIDEADSLAARALLADEVMFAPDLLWIECAASLGKKVRRAQIDPAQAVAAYATIDAMPVASIASRPHVAAAQSIGLTLDQTAYDSLYLAVALSTRALFVTSDERFARAAHAHPLYRDWVRILGR